MRTKLTIAAAAAALAVVAMAAVPADARSWRHGGGHRHHHGGHHGGYYGGGAFAGGLLGGMLLGGALAAQPRYYGEPAYGYYEGPAGDAVAYCLNRFKSYDPASGTYLGYDGRRHPCP